MQNEVPNESNSDSEDDLEDMRIRKRKIQRQRNRYICFHSSHMENEVSSSKIQGFIDRPTFYLKAGFYYFICIPDNPVIKCPGNISLPVVKDDKILFKNFK